MCTRYREPPHQCVWYNRQYNNDPVTALDKTTSTSFLGGTTNTWNQQPKIGTEQSFPQLLHDDLSGVVQSGLIVGKVETLGAELKCTRLPKMIARPRPPQGPTTTLQTGLSTNQTTPPSNPTISFERKNYRLSPQLSGWTICQTHFRSARRKETTPKLGPGAHKTPF